VEVLLIGNIRVIARLKHIDIEDKKWIQHSVDESCLETVSSSSDSSVLSPIYISPMLSSPGPTVETTLSVAGLATVPNGFASCSW